jgi:hypothetical protein
MRRFKIKAVDKFGNKPNLFDNKPIHWTVFDTLTGEQSGDYESGQDAAKASDKLENVK